MPAWRMAPNTPRQADRELTARKHPCWSDHRGGAASIRNSVLLPEKGNWVRELEIALNIGVKVIRRVWIWAQACDHGGSESRTCRPPRADCQSIGAVRNRQSNRPRRP